MTNKTLFLIAILTFIIGATFIFSQSTLPFTLLGTLLVFLSGVAIALSIGDTQ